MSEQAGIYKPTDKEAEQELRRWCIQEVFSKSKNFISSEDAMVESEKLFQYIKNGKK